MSADSWPEGKPFSQEEPAIGIWFPTSSVSSGVMNGGTAGRRVLLDGYCRSVIFARHGGDADQFLVWMPEDGRFAQGE